MPQIGILFDSQKLGSGFHGYTAFRILFNVVPAREMAGCTLYHGEIGEGRMRPYCIAVETRNTAVPAKIRQLFAASMARGLMPLSERFADEIALQEEVLATAASLTAQGELADCHSRWLQEAWQRGQAQNAMAAPEPVRPAGRAKQRQEARISSRRVEKTPWALSISAGGRKAFGLLLAFSVAGAMAPWFGWGPAACALMFVAGVVQGFAARWRMWAEERASGDEMLQEAKRMLAGNAIQEAADRFAGEGAQASPLPRRLYSTMRATDMASACLMAEEHEQADIHVLNADVHEVRMHGWAVAGAAAVSLALPAALQGKIPMTAEMARLALMGMSGCILLQWMASLLAVRGERMLAEIRRVMGGEWLPALAKALPAGKAHLDGVEGALRELTREFQAMRSALERRRDTEFVDTMTDLRKSVDQLAPVLAGFREPFVLQAVPAPPPRPKAMSATA